MVSKRKPEEGGAVFEGVWATQLFKHIKYFNDNHDLFDISVILPFGIPRERKPKNYEKEEKRKIEQAQKKYAVMRNLTQRPLGAFYVEDEIANIPEWKPRLKPMHATEDFAADKPTMFVLRHDPSDKKVMYLEQDLMAKPSTLEIDKKTGFSYRIIKDRSIVVRKYVVEVSEKMFMELVKDFIKECNRVLYFYCDTQ